MTLRPVLPFMILHKIILFIVNAICHFILSSPMPSFMRFTNIEPSYSIVPLPVQVQAIQSLKLYNIPKLHMHIWFTSN